MEPAGGNLEELPEEAAAEYERMAGWENGNQERVQLEGWKSSTCPAEPWVLTTERVLQVILRSLDFVPKATGNVCRLLAGQTFCGSSASGREIRGDR